MLAYLTALPCVWKCISGEHRESSLTILLILIPVHSEDLKAFLVPLS